MITLIPKHNRDKRVGNAILYGFGVSDVDDSTQFLVETDFGNHMRLSATEFDGLFLLKGPCRYDDWNRARHLLIMMPQPHRDQDIIPTMVMELAVDDPA